MWPNRTADGNTKSSTPGLLSESKENELEENLSSIKNQLNPIESVIPSNSTNVNTPSNNNTALEEFPILDELDRLAKVNTFFGFQTFLKIRNN
jgi:hypothetical protein